MSLTPDIVSMRVSKRLVGSIALLLTAAVVLYRRRSDEAETAVRSDELSA